MNHFDLIRIRYSQIITDPFLLWFAHVSGEV